MEFDVGVKFKYMGNYFPKEFDRTQEVLHILKIDGVLSVRAKFIDNDYVHIFEISKNKKTYSSNCYPLKGKLDNGIPMFWDEEIK